jgi:uncharacterized protein (TIGR03118 family)
MFTPQSLSPLSRLLTSLLAAAAVLTLGSVALADGYLQTNMVSDGTAPLTITDANSKNPWGIAFGPSTPFWVADNNAGVSTLYNSVGEPLPLVVTIPPPMGQTGMATPDGIVFNGTSDFAVTSNGKTGTPLFIFATEDGTISGWAPSVNGHNAILAVDQSQQQTVYKGLAIARNGKANFLYATDFRHNLVDVFNSGYTMVNSFTDTTLPAGYAPFGIQTVSNFLVVTFAEQDQFAHDPVHGAGLGFVDLFTTSGRMVRRIASQGVLNAPWGVAVAPPKGFGEFGGDLLIGNFGDGTIWAFNLFGGNGSTLGVLSDTKGKPIVNDGLWAIKFGNGNGAGLMDVLYFTAGPNGESNGLFGQIQSTPDTDGDGDGA